MRRRTNATPPGIGGYNAMLDGTSLLRRQYDFSFGHAAMIMLVRYLFE